jgi:hypothetical protein
MNQGWICIGGLLLAACGGGSYGEPLSQAEATDLCRQGCDYDNECDPSEPTLMACYDNCDMEIDTLAAIAGGALEELLACRLDLACSDDPDVCQAQLDTQPYQEAMVDACAAYVSRCDAVLDCDFENLELLSAPYCDAATACFEGACEDANDCFADVLDEFNLD